MIKMDKEKELPKRKPTRLQNFDYNSEGAYFITICTEKRKNILSTISTVGEGSPLPQLSLHGKIVDKWILTEHTSGDASAFFLFFFIYTFLSVAIAKNSQSL